MARTATAVEKRTYMLDVLGVPVICLDDDGTGTGTGAGTGTHVIAVLVILHIIRAVGLLFCFRYHCNHQPILLGW